MVSAWANQMVVGQLSTDEKSNEITAVPELLAALDITEKIITDCLLYTSDAADE